MDLSLKAAYWKFRRTVKNSLTKTGVLLPIEDVRAEFEISQRTSVASKVGQLQLISKWRSMLHSNEPLPSFGDVEFRAFSQNGEDGILLYIFSLIGTRNRTSVEICSGDGIQCNSANLLLNHGWTGLLVDGDERLVE